MSPYQEQPGRVVTAIENVPPTDSINWRVGVVTYVHLLVRSLLLRKLATIAYFGGC